jgi:hypothetical protein
MVQCGFRKNNPFIKKKIDIKTITSIVTDSKLGQSCWAVTQRDR